MTPHRHGPRRASTGALLTVLACSGLTAAYAAGGSEHDLPGGFNGLQRIRAEMKSTSTQGGSPAVLLPQVDTLYFVPLTIDRFDESQATRFSMTGDGCITVLKSGLYQINANVDWPAQARGSGQSGYDVNYRKVLIKRVPVGTPPPVYTPGKVTPIPTTPNGWDDMTAHDTPGSDPPRYARGHFTWAPGVIRTAASMSVEVAIAGGAFTPDTGDVAQAAYSGLGTAVLGADDVGMRISARVSAPGTVRVTIENRNDHDVNLGTGQLNVVASSTMSDAGNSIDAWTYMASPPVYLLAGEKLFLAARSGSAGDFIQTTTLTFVQVMNLVP